MTKHAPRSVVVPIRARKSAARSPVRVDVEFPYDVGDARAVVEELEHLERRYDQLFASGAPGSFLAETRSSVEMNLSEGARAAYLIEALAAAFWESPMTAASWVEAARIGLLAFRKARHLYARNEGGDNAAAAYAAMTGHRWLGVAMGLRRRPLAEEHARAAADLVAAVASLEDAKAAKREQATRAAAARHSHTTRTRAAIKADWETWRVSHPRSTKKAFDSLMVQKHGLQLETVEEYRRAWQRGED